LRVSLWRKNVNALVRSFALAVAFGTTAAAASAKTVQSAPNSAQTAQSAPKSTQTAQSTPDVSRGASVSAPTGATAPSRNQQAISGRRSDPDAEAIEQQFRWRVLMPALSGDGG
jgi:hypothetical protein